MTFTSTATGWNTNYSLSAASSTSDPGDFPSGSFAVSRSGSALTGGAKASYSFSVGYAPDGDVTSANDSSSGDWTSFQYDPLNRLVASSCTANCPDGQNTQAFTHTYQYDAEGRWISVDGGSTAKYISCREAHRNETLSSLCSLPMPASTLIESATG